jgi:hypothetical protein
MRVVFAGPTLRPFGKGIAWRGPAKHGDLLQAVLEGATHIGLIDGLYDEVASVWHKEILHALHSGVRVFGAASIGALRAAECASFGMIGIGTIFQRYASGELDDDAAVAQLHAPAELGFMPLTEALVNVEATIARILEEVRVTRREAALLHASARRLFFKERTHVEVALSSGIRPQARALRIAELLDEHRIDLKRADGLLLVERILREDEARPEPKGWRYADTGVWRDCRARIEASTTGREVHHASITPHHVS